MIYVLAVIELALIVWMASLEVRHRSLVVAVEMKAAKLRSDFVQQVKTIRSKIDSTVAGIKRKLP